MGKDALHSSGLSDRCSLVKQIQRTRSLSVQQHKQLRKQTLSQIFRLNNISVPSAWRKDSDLSLRYTFYLTTTRQEASSSSRGWKLVLFDRFYRQFWVCIQAVNHKLKTGWFLWYEYRKCYVVYTLIHSVVFADVQLSNKISPIWWIQVNVILSHVDLTW